MADLDKIVDQLSKLTLLEAAELKTMLEEKWGVSAAAAAPMMMAAMPGGTGAIVAEEEEKIEFDVVLADAGPKKIQVIKAVRALTELGLKEAKDLVEGAPQTVMSAVTKEAAEDARTKLEAEGAVVKIQ
jgi:large subunit ribosomal protein L7/L12